MQTSKINIGDIYAIKDDNDQLTRFKPTKIVTVRNSRGISTVIEGELMRDDKTTHCSFDPKNIAGPYDQFQELVEKAQQEKAARELEKKRLEDRAEAIFAAFCRLIGHPKPKKVKSRYADQRPQYGHDELFRINYSNVIEVSSEGMDYLAKVLKVDEVNNSIAPKNAE